MINVLMEFHDWVANIEIWSEFITYHKSLLLLLLPFHVFAAKNDLNIFLKVKKRFYHIFGTLRKWNIKKLEQVTAPSLLLGRILHLFDALKEK